MKKLLVILAAAALACVANAQKFTVVEGNLDFLKDVTELQVSLTWDNTMMGEMTEAEYVESKLPEKEDPEEFKRLWYEQDRATALEMLGKSFSGSLGKRSLVEVNNTARYKFVFNIDKIDLGFAGVGFVSRGTLIDATIRVVDTTTGGVMAVIAVDESKSATMYVMEQTKAVAFDNLGNKTGKWLVKKKYVMKK
ncbi:MAG TPA: hypothetical protein H9982_04675 [Candidatus Barnesiella excrementipullorum]|uniref:Uncharacterized protein n=1 Tax=Candidatus Barnesiella excrementipullorum TaxID=2838479 RepID=A0A9D1VS15_9BACT|nr:hypothetical protein [Candidatus Barnesiella excrementipullorum]